VSVRASLTTLGFGVLVTSSCAVAPTGSASVGDQQAAVPENARGEDLARVHTSSGDVACGPGGGMVRISGGSYEDGVGRAFGVDEFWLDRYETTVSEYRACVNAGGCSEPHPAPELLKYVVCTWSLEEGDNLPVNCLDWHMADAYCRWRDKRLPTEPEWVWAARGRDEGRPWPWGDAPPSCEYAVIDPGDDQFGCGRDQPWPVGSKPAGNSRDGISDMVGNVNEWTSTSRPGLENYKYGLGGAFAVFVRVELAAHLGGHVTKATYSDGTGVRCASTEPPACSDTAAPAGAGAALSLSPC
jgi:formylglycine-generating enzyme required for sulfatase activity